MVEEFYECNIITSNVQNIINVKNISDELSSTYTSRTPKFCLMDLTIMSFPITGNARIYTYPEKMSFSQNQPRIFKPGLKYTYIVR
jgi:hypothetical protein